MRVAATLESRSVPGSFAYRHTRFSLQSCSYCLIESTTPHFLPKDTPPNTAAPITTAFSPTLATLTTPSPLLSDATDSIFERAVDTLGKACRECPLRSTAEYNAEVLRIASETKKQQTADNTNRCKTAVLGIRRRATEAINITNTTNTTDTTNATNATNTTSTEILSEVE
ncbi:hypothetical protein KI688_006285 [Linnemannia hyalina]|uniref:Uncharacterized protein n=1 Tax=Linnemannia hyalina TaxID=64524 RepID=A0A9P7Y4C1_9FUNG|nr:hypothetical protein KI688_006285 [Linnemannia hyalina]